MEGQHHGQKAQSPPQHHQIPLQNSSSPMGYSNLEVVPQDNARNAPEAYYSSAPEPVPGGYYDPGKEPVSGSHAFSSPAGYGSSYQPTGSPNSGSGAAYQPMGPAPDEKPKGTVMMKKKTLWIVVAVAILVVIGAVVGGAVGGTLGARNRSSQADGAAASPQPSPSGSNATNGSSNGIVLGSSAISALNYTIRGTDYRIVFWQPSTASSEIVYSLWDSANKSWEVVKLQSRLGGSEAVEAKPGTALSAVARPMLSDKASPSLSLFYLSASNAVQELRTQDARGASWSKQTHPIAAANVSQLAAVWDVCNNPKCSGQLGLAYEDETSRQVWYWPNATADSSNRTTKFTQKITSGSGIAITTASGATNSSDRDNIKLYLESAGNLIEVVGDPKPSWLITQTGLVSNLPTDKPPTISTVGFARDVAATYLLVVIRYRDGSLQALYWNSFNWRQPAEPVTRNTPSGLGKKFNAVSATTDLRIYALAPDGNAIHVFTADPNDPLTWTYDSQVKLN